MKNLIIVAFLITVTSACYDYSGYSEAFDHCDAEPARFENTFDHIDSNRTCTFPWHDHEWDDRMTLEHAESNIYTLHCYDMILETVRDGCDFNIIEQEMELSGKLYKISGIGKHSRRIDNDSGPPGDFLRFDITYGHDGVTTECYIRGTRYY